MNCQIEAARLGKLVRFDLLDTPPERDFDAVTWLARHLLDCPISAISLVDEHRQWFKSLQGLDVCETPRDVAFCAHAIHYDDIMVVEDATLDPRFVDNPLVTGNPGIRFYAGIPLRPHLPGESDDLPGIGTLCIIDTKARALSPHEAKVLRDLAALAGSLIEARSNAAASQKLAQLADQRASEIDRKHRQLRQAERMAGIGSWRVDLLKQSVEWSEQVYVIHGLPIGDTPPLEDALKFFPEYERGEVVRKLDRTAVCGEPFDFEVDFITADGRLRRVRSIGEAECVDGNPVALIGVFQDITDRHAQEQALRHSASTDSLTGLPNRAAFESRLDQALVAAEIEDAPLVLLVIDLDGFKAVNDNMGHDAGDEVLRMIGERLRGQRFAHAFPGRLGGDEFVLLVTRPRDCAELQDFIAALLDAMRYTITRDGQVRSVSATIGAARFTHAIPGRMGLMRNADLALYEAKRERRGIGRIFGVVRAIDIDAGERGARIRQIPHMRP